MWCLQVRNQLSAYVDGELNAQRAEAVEVHLSQCEACSREHETFGSVRRLTAAIPLEELPTGLHAGIMARLADEMAASARAFRPARRTPSPWALIGLAGAAAAAVVVIQHQPRPSGDRPDGKPVVSVRSVAVSPKPRREATRATSTSPALVEPRMAAAVMTDKDMKESILPVQRPKPKPESGLSQPTSVPATVPVSAVATRPNRTAVSPSRERVKPSPMVAAADTKPMDVVETPIVKPAKMTMMAVMMDPGKGMEKPADTAVGTLTPQPVIIINESESGREDEGVDILRMALEERNQSVPQPPSVIPARSGRTRDNL